MTDSDRFLITNVYCIHVFAKSETTRLKCGSRIAWTSNKNDPAHTGPEDGVKKRRRSFVHRCGSTSDAETRFAWLLAKLVRVRQHASLACFLYLWKWSWNKPQANLSSNATLLRPLGWEREFIFRYRGLSAMPEGCHSALNRDPMGEGKRNAKFFRDDICLYKCAPSHLPPH